MDDLDAEFDVAIAGLRTAGLPEDTPAGDYSHDALALAWGSRSPIPPAMSTCGASGSYGPARTGSVTRRGEHGLSHASSFGL